MKLCPRCRTQKPPEDFPRDRSRGSGLGVYCRACYAAQQRRQEYEEWPVPKVLIVRTKKLEPRTRDFSSVTRRRARKVLETGGKVLVLGPGRTWQWGKWID